MIFKVFFLGGCVGYTPESDLQLLMGSERGLRVVLTTRAPGNLMGASDWAAYVCRHGEQEPPSL